MLFLVVLRSFHCSCLFNDFIMHCHNSLFADWVELELRVGDISDTKPLVSVFSIFYVCIYVHVCSSLDIRYHNDAMQGYFN